MNKLRAELVFAATECSAQDMFYALEAVRERLGLEPNDYSSAHEVESIDAAKHLRISGERLSVRGLTIGGSVQDWFQIETESMCLGELTDLVEALIKELQPIQAFIHDAEYNFWQNAADPLEYECSGRSHIGLPKVSNGLPFPLEQEVIDTSANPGRFLIKQGYREAVSSPMWIAESLIGNISQLKTVPKLAVKPIGTHVRIEYNISPFTSADGEQAYVQNAIRGAIYGV